MMTLLEQAFTEAAKLPLPEQEVLARRLLDELIEENEFDRTIARTADKVAKLAGRALKEHRAGLTEELDPERI